MLKDISFNDALKIILENTPPLSVEKIFIDNSLDRVIAEDVYSPYNIPYYDNSAMDGYAVKFSDTIKASETTPVKLKIVNEIPAGKIDKISIQKGEAVKIMTGGIVPKGANAIARKEITKEENGYVHIFQPLTYEKDIRKAGEDVKKESLIIKKNNKITPATMGMLAAMGKSYVKVYRKPIISVLITGDEILDIDSVYVPGKIRNSNGFTLLGLLKQLNITPILSEIIKDNKVTLMNKIEESLNSDIIISTGGVSMGDYDFVKDIVPQIGFEPVFWRVKVKPGKPLFFAKQNNILYFGIPGNPVSTMTTFYNFILPCINKMNNSANLEIPTVKAIITEDIKRKDLRTEFIRGILFQKNNHFYVKTTGAQGSGILTSMLHGNCFIFIEESRETINAGDTVTVKIFNYF